ncbi:hypothetical protein FOIG_08888 [Fusarium odoratissimum NRRL 54006]|uniref:Uncharacterized protein n=2 Tax=Fusarium oxysporum species complex TaxID=171631 RepID=X0JRA0_FUSO5|nr:uncharacterized protein FOIG_08888 [Fusarium odoratissimum NRRL 54006]EXL98976.1 hypothetical protein FOIG_08888 [Fusarium odoratissimum NRRL 54006]TXC01083.1 hypothetical protein FocTR4_00009170 [Fusarium oxysporum f. sp. cubense]
MPPNRLSPRKTRRWLVYRGFPSTMLLLIKQEGIGNTNNTLQYQLVRKYSRITAMTGRRPLEKRSHLHCPGPCKWTDTSINPKAARPQNKLAVSLRDRPPFAFWDQRPLSAVVCTSTNCCTGGFKMASVFFLQWMRLTEALK